MASDYFSNAKKKSPLTPKAVEQMPHSLAGLSYKEWRDSKKKNHKMRNIRWAFLLFMNLLFVASFFLDRAFHDSHLLVYFGWSFFLFLDVSLSFFSRMGRKSS